MRLSLWVSRKSWSKRLTTSNRTSRAETSSNTRRRHKGQTPRFEELENRIALSADRFETNESLLTATAVGVGPGVHLSNLSIHSTSDQDWYKFEVLNPDSIDVKANFLSAAGNLDLQITDAVGTVIGQGNSLGDNEVVTLTGLAAGTYYARVFGVAGATNAYSLSLVPSAASTTRVFYVNDSSASNDFYALALGNDANSGLSPNAPKATVQDILTDYDLGPGDLILIDTGTYGTGTVTITAADEAATFAGAPGGSNFNFAGTRFDLVDADFTMIYGLGFTGSGGTGIYVRSGTVNPSTNEIIRNNRFTGASTAIQISGGDAHLIEGNTISGSGQYGVYLTLDGSATVRGNTISGRTYAIQAEGSPGSSGDQLLVESNTLSTGSNGVNTGSWSNSVTLSQNQVSGFSSYGIYASTNSLIQGNSVSNSGVGIHSQASGSQVMGNLVYQNTTGMSGSGTFGGTDWSAASVNEVYSNVTGIRPSAGAMVQFNRIRDNTGAGIIAASSTSIYHNLLYRNAGQGILVDAASGVSIVNNTIHATLGDAVRLQSSSSSVALKNNILWA